MKEKTLSEPCENPCVPCGKRILTAKRKEDVIPIAKGSIE